MVSAYVDFILTAPGLLRHQYLRRLLVLSQRMTPALFLRTVERAHRYRITSLETLETDRPAAPGRRSSELPLPSIDESFGNAPPIKRAR